MTFNTKKKYVNIVAHDKKSLKEVSRFSVYGYDSDRKSKLKDAICIGTFFTDKEMVIIYKIRANKKEPYDIYAEVWDEKFKNKVKLTKFISIKDYLKKNNSRELIGIKILQSENKSEYSAIMEFSNGQDKNLTLAVVTFDMKLTKFPSSVTELPLQQLEKKAPERITGNYYFPGDGFLYAKHSILENNDRTSKKWKNGKRKLVIHRFDPATEEMDQYEIKDEEYSLSDITIVSNGKKTKIIGFYQDPESIEKGNLIHGVFVTGFNSRNDELEEISFQAFSKDQFEEMFHSRKLSKSEQKAADKKAKKNKTVAPEDDKSYSLGDLVIDDIHMDEKGNITIFSSFMNNYSIRRCSTVNGVQSCYYEQYCNRTDVNVMHLSNDNKLQFALHIDRTATYNGSYVSDLRTAKSGDRYYLYYGDYTDYIGSENRKETRKKRKQDGVIDFKYAVVDMSNKTITKKTKAIEQVSKKKKEIRMINPLGITVIDGEVYSFNIITRMGYKAIPVYVLIVPQYFAMTHPEMVYNYYGTIARITPK